MARFKLPSFCRNALRVQLWVSILFITTASSAKSKSHFKLSIHLPGGHDKPFSSDYMMPVAAMLTEKVPFTYIYNDTQCNEGIAMNNVIDVYINQNMTAILGPVCDFAAAPVARQTSYWNRAMLTVGAFARDFKVRKNSFYKLLTRAGPINFSDLGYFLTWFLADHGYTKLQLVYDKVGFEEMTPMFCHLAMESLVYEVEGNDYRNNVSQSYYRLTQIGDLELLRQEFKEESAKFGLTTAGESAFFQPPPPFLCSYFLKKITDFFFRI